MDVYYLYTQILLNVLRCSFIAIQLTIYHDYRHITVPILIVTDYLLSLYAQI